MKDRRPNPDRPEDDALEPLIQAVRRDQPTEEQWEAARSRLTGALEAKGRQTQPRGWGGLLLLWVTAGPRVRYVGLSAGVAAVAMLIAVVMVMTLGPSKSAWADAPTAGELLILGPAGELRGRCPLKHTEVEAHIIGFVARVGVRQVFHNPLDEPIEAVYQFPLPENAAVDDMVMVIGARRIVGVIQSREEARQTYQTARAQGHVAGLLEQERPNLFTQSVANIEPGAEVVIEIKYSNTLDYHDGVYEFIHPMTIGPRYIPGVDPNNPFAPPGSIGVLQGTGQVPDADRVTPPIAAPGTRAGHDINVTVEIDAGLEIQSIESVLHEVKTRNANGRATVALKNKREIPNRDFVLRYSTATDRIENTLLVHKDERGRFFTLILQPPQSTVPEQITPKELIFVIDRSGSMSGAPIEQAKAAMKLCIEQLGPDDTFNLHSFSGGTGQCFQNPLSGTAENVESALKYLEGLYGSGGTQMMPAILRALGGPKDPQRVRIVCFMTDGQIGNDFAIIDAVRNNADTSRVFSFGVGNSVNRFLLDGMAWAGRGAVETITLSEDPQAAAERFFMRVHAPVLTDIEIDWRGLQVEEVYPVRHPDLFDHQPIMVHGRIEGPAVGAITLRGQTGSGLYEEDIPVIDAGKDAHRDVLASLWARAKVDDLMHRDMNALQTRNFPENLRQAVTRIGVDYRLMTQFTSFVAVDETRSVSDGDPTQVIVPQEAPDHLEKGEEISAGILGVRTDVPGSFVSDGADTEHRVVYSRRRGLAPRAKTQSENDYFFAPPEAIDALRAGRESNNGPSPLVWSYADGGKYNINGIAPLDNLVTPSPQGTPTGQARGRSWGLFEGGGVYSDAPPELKDAPSSLRTNEDSVDLYKKALSVRIDKPSEEGHRARDERERGYANRQPATSPEPGFPPGKAGVSENLGRLQQKPEQSAQTLGRDHEIKEDDDTLFGFQEIPYDPTNGTTYNGDAYWTKVGVGPVKEPMTLRIALINDDGTTAGLASISFPADPEKDPRRGEHKLFAPLLGLVKLVAKGKTVSDLTDGEVKVRDGKVEVLVYLNDLSTRTLKKLKVLGFKTRAISVAPGKETVNQTQLPKVVIGRIDVARLKKLARLPEARFVVPFPLDKLPEPAVEKE